MVSLLAPPAIPQPPQSGPLYTSKVEDKPVRSGGRHKGGLLAAQPPILHDHDALQARLDARAASARFVEVMLPLLAPEARARAQAVRIKGGDAALLGAI